MIEKPRIGITAGDPAGIGPEVVLRAINDPELLRECTPVIIGDETHLDYIAERIVGSSINFCSYDSESAPGCVRFFDLKNVDYEALRFGHESANTGKSSADYIEKAVGLWRDGSIDAIATAPISKNALKLAGYDYPGHTEFFAALTDTEEFAMSFFAEKLRVVLLSTHVSLKKAIDLVSTDSLIRLIEFADRTLPEFIGRQPKIAVAGVNPHASEGGMFGDEEAKFIAPGHRSL
jgi:4-phospho-D-threonate 3-dehydrogenase / 4-phospho-D-erythronate 3-dehydrogenase